LVAGVWAKSAIVVSGRKKTYGRRMEPPIVARRR
jgi:hypothetical protein